MTQTQRLFEERRAGAFLSGLISAHRLSERGSVYLDCLRGLSAIFVMISHLRGLFFVSFGDVENPSPLVTVLYFLTSLGHQAVIVFFVLSGYFIAGSVMRALNDGSWQWRPYAVRRFARLYVVLIPALLAGGLIDFVGIKFFGGSGIYTADPDYTHIIAYVVQDRLNFQTLAANILFLEGIWSSTFGSNSPLWSLAYEFWFYVMFPCMALVVATSSSLVSRLLFGVAVVAIAVFVGPVIFAYFFIWLLGAVIAVAPAPRQSLVARYGLLGSALAACFALLAVRAKISVSYLTFDAIFAVVIAILVYVLANWPQTKALSSAYILWFSRFSRGIAGFSYTLYLVHLPLLVLLTATMISNGASRWQPDMMHGVVGVGIALAVLIYAWIVSRLTEAHTAQVARYFLRHLKGRRG
jgi:peptidoglycan/LPS O-acetylase OafA/YrhL